MPVAGNYTARDLITAALRKIGVVAEGEQANADQIETGLRTLDRMLKAWQNRGYLVWSITEITVPLTTAATYVMAPPRPMRIMSARLRRAGIDTPMQEFTRQEYDALPLKQAKGLPTCYYYDRQREAATLTVWPVLAAANGEEIRVTCEREIEDVTDLNAPVDVPGEWWEAVVYGLASRLADDYGVTADRIVLRAEAALFEARAADREGSVWFGHAAG
jgi:hypothetical protein